MWQNSFVKKECWYILQQIVSKQPHKLLLEFANRSIEETKLNEPEKKSYKNSFIQQYRHNPTPQNIIPCLTFCPLTKMHRTTNSSMWFSKFIHYLLSQLFDSQKLQFLILTRDKFISATYHASKKMWVIFPFSDQPIHCT